MKKNNKSAALQKKEDLLNKYGNEIAMEKVLTLLVLYREKGKTEYPSFEEYVESILRAVYGNEVFEVADKRIKKKLKQEVTDG